MIWLPLDEVIATSNILSLHLPLTEENRHLIDAAALAAMPEGSVIVNVSRGGLIDEDALADSLASGHLSGAGIDTFEIAPLPTDSRLLEFQNVRLSPHAAHFSTESAGGDLPEVARPGDGRAEGPSSDERRQQDLSEATETLGVVHEFSRIQEQECHRDRPVLRHR